MINRWVVLIAGCLIQTTLGGIYAWSTFVPYLAKGYGLRAGQCGFIFGLTVLIFTMAMILAGRVLVKKGPRFTAAIAAGLFMCGYLVASVSGGSYPLLLLSLGGMVGCGIGFGYVCPLSVGMKWFPDKKGLVTGVAVAGFGLGAVLLASVAEHFLLNGMDVLRFFRWFGLSSGMVLFITAMFLAQPQESKAGGEETHDMSAVFSWPFYLSAISLFAGTFGGLLIIGNLTPLIIQAGFNETHAAACVSIFAVGNGIGRIVWGKFFDHYAYKTIPLSLGSFAVVAAVLLVPVPEIVLISAVGLIGFCFGGNFVIYASSISRFFGTASFPWLYPLCFMAYGVAGVIGPGLGGYLADSTGTYNTAIYICIGLVVGACILSVIKLDVFNKEEQS